MVDLLALTSLEQLIFDIESIIYLYIKQATLRRRSTVMSLSLHSVFPAPAVEAPDS
jgi:hypothetical protein